MTNINCTYNCIYQYDGCCCFDIVTPLIINTGSDCIYFTKRDNQERISQEQRFRYEEPIPQF